MIVTNTYPDEDIATFADTVRRNAQRHAAPDTWIPGAQASDSSPLLIAALDNAGWLELVDAGADGLGYLGAGGHELGRSCAPYDCVTTLLGGAPYAEGIALYARPDTPVVRWAGGPDLIFAPIEASTPVPYTDNVGAHVVHRLGPTDTRAAGPRLAGWQTATVGYLGGLCSAALDRAVEHAAGRQAFGSPLFDLAPVQLRLADAAVIVTGLQLSATRPADPEAALAYACARAPEVAAHTHQVLGAMGFTLEYDLQRHTRRIQTVSVLAGSWLTAAMCL